LPAISANEPMLRWPCRSVALPPMYPFSKTFPINPVKSRPSRPSRAASPANTIIPGTTIEVPNLGQQTAVKGGEVPKNIEAMIEKGGGETRF